MQFDKYMTPSILVLHRSHSTISPVLQNNLAFGGLTTIEA